MYYPDAAVAHRTTQCVHFSCACSTKVEHIKKRVSYTKENSSFQRLAYLSEADQHYVRTVMYPWDVQLYELACRHSNAIVK